MMMMNSLRCRVVEARDLMKADFLGLSDPFCELRIVSMVPMPGHLIQKTRVINNTLCPIWNQDFAFSTPRPRDDNLEIKVYDYDVGSNNDLLGSVLIPISSLFGVGHLDTWFDLRSPSNRNRKGKGQIHVILDYQGEGRVGITQVMPAVYPPPMQMQMQGTYYPPPQQYGGYPPPPQQYGGYPPPPQQYGGYPGYPPQPQPGYGTGYPPNPYPPQPQPGYPYPSPYGGGGYPRY